MAKKRTRKQKEKAKRRLEISWEPETLSKPKKQKSKPNVKRQITKSGSKLSSKISKTKNANNSAEADALNIIKKDIMKSLILAGLIVGSEIVLYLAWNN